jgi:hypothetical protein
MLIDIVVKPLWARGKTPLDSELRKMSERRELFNKKIETLQNEISIRRMSYLSNGHLTWHN